ncbi:MAG: MBOAT family O-acyltransferase, partial [Myxococcota bacterium]|nr:MBOAT family O-acyltransferase [Myxococcota bacterium]
MACLGFGLAGPVLYERAFRSDERHRRRVFLLTSVVANLGVLGFFKYYDFFRDNWTGLGSAFGLEWAPPVLAVALPVGISFYTFQTMSYTIDVYRGHVEPERSLLRLALYVAYFPQLVAGPILRPAQFLPALEKSWSLHRAAILSGFHLVLVGLFKKVLIADRIAPLVDLIFSDPGTAPSVVVMLGAAMFAVQIYCDFSGYSDMAIGAAKVLGIDLMENFRRPYFSTSVPEFWTRRWHLSLAGWFRDYLYVPLGGSRRSRLRLYANVLAVFLVSGLWHGASWTFVVWGGLNGLYQVCSLATRGMRERVCAAVRLPGGLGGLLRGLLTFHLILVTWIFFRAASLADATTIVSRVTASLATLPRLLQVRIANPEIL